MGNGGYDDGYSAMPCFWGKEPGSLVRTFLSQHSVEGMDVLDLGCGEGKNANAFAKAGSRAVAVDCSKNAIRNGKTAFSNPMVEWHIADAQCFASSQLNCAYDVLIAYGLLHCLASESAVISLVHEIQRIAKPGGTAIIVAFNNRSQDLSAHPGFDPLLLEHSWYLNAFSDWEIKGATDTDLYETHPHNEIPHHHSLTRMVVRKPE
jgi:ubiquinone/menaquinone biosynthesis C-methylase UbiE